MKPVILDVRRDDEWKDGHVEGATHLSLEDIMFGKIPNVNKDQTLYIYCQRGNRSGIAEQILRSKGFVNVANVGSLEQARKLAQTL